MKRTSARVAAAVLVCALAAATRQHDLLACTGFCAVGNGQVLVGNNEDWDNPRTKVWFVPAKPGEFGRVYVGFDDLYPQGGMNERGLWFDGFATPPIGSRERSGLPSYPGNIVDAAMAQCRTVQEVVDLFERYDRGFLTRAILMFADANGDAASIERHAIVRKTGSHFVQTNFHQSRGSRVKPDARFTTASTMLTEAGSDVSIDLFRRILAATRQQGGSPTLYSNVYELRSKTMYLYHFQDYDHVVTFDLAAELKKGARELDIPALFPRNAAAESFAARRPAPREEEWGGQAIVAAFAVATAVIGVAAFGLFRAGKRVRIGVALGIGVAAVGIGLVVIALNVPQAASERWIEFSIGPASGESVNRHPTGVRANGMTLKAAIAAAYDFPSVRVLGPSWLTDTRYSIYAAVGVEQAESFASMLKEELRRRLQLETHVEQRSFDVFVLRAPAPRVERGDGMTEQAFIQKRSLRMQGMPMATLASVLQSVLRAPVIDETGLTGPYKIEFEWGDDPVTSVTAVLRDRFGLQLSPEKRNMDALIVDHVRRDAALVLQEYVGRATRAAPYSIRQHIARMFAVH